MGIDMFGELHFGYREDFMEFSFHWKLQVEPGGDGRQFIGCHVTDPLLESSEDVITTGDANRRPSSGL